MNRTGPETAHRRSGDLDFAAGAMAEALRLNLALRPELMELANAMALNEDAMKTLRETLPKASKIKPTYVYADWS